MNARRLEDGRWTSDFPNRASRSRLRSPTSNCFRLGTLRRVCDSTETSPARIARTIRCFPRRGDCCSSMYTLTGVRVEASMFTINAVLSFEAENAEIRGERFGQIERSERKLRGDLERYLELVLRNLLALNLLLTLGALILFKGTIYSSRDASIVYLSLNC